MSERPRPDMFDEAMKAAKEGDMFDQAMERARKAPTVEPGTEDTRPVKAEVTGDIFDMAMADAMEPETELKDEDLEEVEGDMFDLAGAQIVDQKPRIKLKKPIVAEQKPQGDMFDEAMKGDMFDQAMERARKSIADASDEAMRVPEAPPPIAKEAEETVMEISDEDIISEEELPDEQERRKAA